MNNSAAAVAGAGWQQHGSTLWTLLNYRTTLSISVRAWNFNDRHEFCSSDGVVLACSAIRVSRSYGRRRRCSESRMPDTGNPTPDSVSSPLVTFHVCIAVVRCKCRSTKISIIPIVYSGWHSRTSLNECGTYGTRSEVEHRDDRQAIEMTIFHLPEQDPMHIQASFSTYGTGTCRTENLIKLCVRRALTRSRRWHKDDWHPHEIGISPRLVPIPLLAQELSWSSSFSSEAIFPLHTDMCSWNIY